MSGERGPGITGLAIATTLVLFSALLDPRLTFVLAALLLVVLVASGTHRLEPG